MTWFERNEQTRTWIIINNWNNLNSQIRTHYSSWRNEIKASFWWHRSSDKFQEISKVVDSEGRSILRLILRGYSRIRGGKDQRRPVSPSIICLTFHACSTPETENTSRVCLPIPLAQADPSGPLHGGCRRALWRGPRRIEDADVYFNATRRVTSQVDLSILLAETWEHRKAL